MRTRFLIPSLCSVALVCELASAVPAMSADAAAAPGRGLDVGISVKGCNDTPDPAFVAVSYIPMHQKTWYVQGWFQIAANSCAPLFQTSNGIFYAHAEVQHSDGTVTVWGDKENFCVRHPDQFAFYNDDKGACSDEWSPASFSELADGDPQPTTYTYRIH